MTNSVKPVTPRGEQTRQKLLEAAELEFGEKGFHASSVSSITQQAGVAQGTFYIYYSSKEDILRALVDELNRRLRRSLREATETSGDRLRMEKRGIEHFLEFAREHKNLYRIMMQCLFVDEAAYRRYYETLTNVYAKRLKDAQEAGEIKRGDPMAQAWALIGLNYFLGLNYSVWNDAPPPQEVMETVLDFINHGLAPER
ncbi:TetR/AcrR family transcriptional regulator [Alkalilimnicola ehrlichii]|uniref:TetR/AcrR family transcriptional regulator n=1 Tax=Alkalilimnicola ehrlichii TaxID=351052 RepID=UPI00216171F3|nr:TetR/AcrR family transcriptional regulator [Alkalilimnicola ehrlichii]